MPQYKLLFISLLLGAFSFVLGCEEFEDDFDSESSELDSRSSDVCSKSSGSGDCKPYEAEDRTGTSGCEKATNHGGYTGSGFIDFGGNGTWIEWNNIAAPIAGEYTLTFRYANGSEGNRQAAIIVGGKNRGNVSFAKTDRWTSWKTITFKVFLSKGNNTIRVQANTGSGGPNLDNMLVVGKNLGGDDDGGGDNNNGGGTGGSCVEVNENKTATLSCGSGEKISRISFASYGQPTGSCNAGFREGSCHATSTKQNVERFCLNRQTCTVSATNGTFGDPCQGTFKKLAVVYECSGGGGDNNDQCPNDPKKTEPGKCGCGVPEGSCDDEDSGSTARPLDKAGNTKLRIASWNTHRGSIFPKTNTVWKAINRSGKYHITRTEGAARIIEAVNADIWLMQETVYGSDLPSGVSENDINNQIASYMRSVTGDSWKVDCNARGLCTMVRGNIRFDGRWERGGRVTGDRVILPDNTRVLLMNGHYMDTSHAEDTRDVIVDMQSTVDAVFVAGDFNDAQGGSRYNVINGIPGMSYLSMVHWKDPNARHLTSAMQNKQHKNTKGFMKWGSGPAGQDLVTAIDGGQIDHFFLKSSRLRAGNRFILNTLLFAPRTLDLYDLEPLDVALQPQYYFDFFKDFLRREVIYEIPAGAYDDDRGLDHDHLPMIVDFSW